MTQKKASNGYRCPLNADREFCVCIKCLNWRNERFLNGHFTKGKG